MSKKGRNILQKYNHWRRNKVNYSMPTTAAGILAGKETKVIVSQDCTADPCSCTGCSAWD